MLKVYRNIYPSIFSKIFHLPDINYDLRINSGFAVPNARSVFHGSENIFHVGPKIWDIVVLRLKELTSDFKKDIQKWEPKSCPCRLCKKYVSNLGYMTVTL